VITGLAGITLWTDDLEGMFRFYHQTLGLPVHSKHADFIAFQLGELRFNIGRHEQIHGPARDPYRMMPHLAVEDLHGEHQRLLALGVEFIRPPELEHWGGWVATFNDPDGNILQFLQFPEPG
jgi:catechol 2,3-dioxygenase-like lactoylglutathione lyase family enzyme